MIVLYQCLLHIVECYHDRNVIPGSDKEERYFNSKWHLLDSIFAVLLHSGIAYLANDPLYVITGLSIRLFMLQVLLNKLRGLPLTYLGGGKIDKFCNDYIGKKNYTC